MTKKSNAKKDIGSVSQIDEHKKPVKPAAAQPDQFFTKEEMSKKNISISGALFYDVMVYLNSRPRVETNTLCVALEKSAIIVELKKSMPNK